MFKTEGDFASGAVISTKPRLSPISAGGLEISLLLKFLCNKQVTLEKMKTFIQTLCDYNFVRTVTNDNSDTEDEMTIGIVSDLYPHGDQQLVCYCDIVGTVIEEDNSDEKGETEIAVSESRPPHAQPAFTCSNSAIETLEQGVNYIQS